MAVRSMALAAVAALLLAAAPGAWAMGSNSDTSTVTTDPSWSQAKQAVQGGRFEAAIPLLNKTVEAQPKNADAWNYLGYASARLGRTDDAQGFYAKALAIDPGHKGANEYLGELHLKLGDLAGAEARLAVLDKECFFGCAEFDALEKAIAAYKASGSYAGSKGF